MISHATVRANRGSRYKSKIVGRGHSSGVGGSCCRGLNGQTKRGDGKVKPLFEGGQTPLARRLPKLKGFNNVNQDKAEVVNLDVIEVLAAEGATRIDAKLLEEKGFIKCAASQVKLLGNGALTKKVTVAVNAASASAKAAVEKAGGALEIVAA